MAKKTRTTKTTTKAPQVDWRDVAKRQANILEETSMGIFELEISLRALADNFYRTDNDVVACLIPTFARAAASIQDRIDMHLAYLPSTEAGE
jgi:hypothetical protein